jgi:tetrahydromethanopterin S-methyltransferase subunit G
MAVAMKESWTDDRLDDFRGDVNRRFDDVNRRFDDVDRRLDKAEAETNRRFDKVDKRFDKVEAETNRRFDEVGGHLQRIDSKMDGMQRTIMLTGGGIIAALIGVIGTQI